MNKYILAILAALLVAVPSFGAPAQSPWNEVGNAAFAPVTQVTTSHFQWDDDDTADSKFMDVSSCSSLMVSFDASVIDDSTDATARLWDCTENTSDFFGKCRAFQELPITEFMTPRQVTPRKYVKVQRLTATAVATDKARYYVSCVRPNVVSTTNPSSAMVMSVCATGVPGCFTSIQAAIDSEEARTALIGSQAQISIGISPGSYTEAISWVPTKSQTLELYCANRNYGFVGLLAPCTITAPAGLDTDWYFHGDTVLTNLNFVLSGSEVDDGGGEIGDADGHAVGVEMTGVGHHSWNGVGVSGAVGPGVKMVRWYGNSVFDLGFVTWRDVSLNAGGTFGDTESAALFFDRPDVVFTEFTWLGGGYLGVNGPATPAGVAALEVTASSLGDDESGSVIEAQIQCEGDSTCIEVDDENVFLDLKVWHRYNFDGTGSDVPQFFVVKDTTKGGGAVASQIRFHNVETLHSPGGVDTIPSASTAILSGSRIIWGDDPSTDNCIPGVDTYKRNLGNTGLTGDYSYECVTTEATSASGLRYEDSSWVAIAVD